MDVAVYLRDFVRLSRPKRDTSFHGNGNAISRGAQSEVRRHRLFFDITVNSLRMLFVRVAGDQRGWKALSTTALFYSRGINVICGLRRPIDRTFGNKPLFQAIPALIRRAERLYGNYRS